MISIDKATATNVIALVCIVSSYYLPNGSDLILSMGLFALSGALTNWLAVHMLFEKVPLLYGSGVIPNRFDEFKVEIKKLVMSQFFNFQTIKNTFSNGAIINDLIDAHHIMEHINFDNAYESFMKSVLGSPIGNAIQMFGGQKLIDSLREPLIKSMKRTLEEIVDKDVIRQAVENSEHVGQTLFDNIDQIVEQRLNELTPKMVKEIVEDMIKKHLGWLVVWGGVFGAAIGVGVRLLPL